jgi:nitrite reductase/ring-hydroxylating ferredoxin subunit
MAKNGVNVGQVDEFPVGKCRIVTVGDVEVGIVRLANGEMHAMRNRCPHKGAPICRGIVGGTWPPSQVGNLDFVRDGEVLVCPWHGYEYDIKTGVELYHDSPTRLRKYQTSIEAGSVFVTI